MADDGQPAGKGAALPADELRRQAEARVDDLSAAAAAAAAAATSRPEEVAAIVHELRVHQIELEMQNEELRRAQVELESSREKYFELFDGAPVGYLTLSDKSIVVDANLTASKLLGVERRTLVGQPFTSFVLREDRPAYYQHWGKLLETREPRAWELRLQRLGPESGAAPDHVWALLESRPQRAEDGETASFWTTFTDISAQKRVEEALRESEATKALAEKIAHAGSYRWDFASQMATWSPGMFLLFDVDPHGFHGDFAPVLEARVHPDDRERVERATTQASATGQPVPVEYRVVWRDGSQHVLFGGGQTECDADGTPVAITGFYRDVTELRRAEAEILGLNEGLEGRVRARTEQLEAVNAELEAFVYSASHDLRAPLRAIDGFSEMVIEDAAERLDAVDTEHLQRVRAAARRMGLLIDHLIALSHAARQDLLLAPTDLSAMAESVLAELREAEPVRRITSLVAPGLVVDADAALLRVILTNLLANAWKFTSHHETACIEVGARDGEDKRCYFVKDDGVGFDPAQAEHLFGAFQRFHAAADFEGDGIGLATVQRLVAKHGGRVWAESEVDQGATFFFTLPPAPASPD